MTRKVVKPVQEDATTTSAPTDSSPLPNTGAVETGSSDNATGADTKSSTETNTIPLDKTLETMMQMIREDRALIVVMKDLYDKLPDVIAVQLAASFKQYDEGLMKRLASKGDSDGGGWVQVGSKILDKVFSGAGEASTEIKELAKLKEEFDKQSLRFMTKKFREALGIADHVTLEG